MGLFSWLGDDKQTTITQEEIKKESDFSSFKDVTDYIYDKSGIVDLDKRALTASSLQQYAVSEGVYTTKEFIDAMQNKDNFYQDIINIATVNETFFMRELKELEWLVSYIKELDRPLKILSMPCSSGEEIYSILLLLKIENFDINKLDIRGYDINSQAIEKAKNARYNEHSLHKIDTDIKDKYFTSIDKSSYLIDSSIKIIPKFMQQNIFELIDQKNIYDIILSRNMFIYFDEKKRELATNIIANLLKSDGIYIKGHADHISQNQSLEKIKYGIYKKLN